MKSDKKLKIHIPRIAILFIIIAFIGMGARGGKYILSSIQPSEENVTPVKPGKPKNSPPLDESQMIRSFSDYDLVAEKNLFNRLGWEKIIQESLPEPVVIRNNEPRERQRDTEPNSDLILTGIVSLAGEPMALVEDTSAGKGYFLREGDKLKDYLVEAIDEESITLARGDSKLMPNLGSDTRYNSSERIVISRSTREQRPESISSESINAETASSDENPANLSLIERMKARRRKELGHE